ncbi:MAG TPA: hypothetical protein VFF65_00180 [Phycisphaerales bacterium]|nr:hypothetical protein [Phycisphaerales bacterium]
MSATATKVCSVCNVDCANRPRVKDELGRYTCKQCVERASAAGQQRADDDGLDLRAAAMMEARSEAAELPEAESCPKCHGFMAASQRLCTRCGYDRKRGAKVMTRVEQVKEQKSDWLSKRRESQRTDRAVGIAVWSLCIALLTAFCIGFYVPLLLVLSFPVLVLVTMATTITLIAFAFIDADRSPAVCGILYVPIFIASLVLLPFIGPIFMLFGWFISFVCWARLMYYGATQERTWLRALANTVVAQILLVILGVTLAVAGVLPLPSWLEDGMRQGRGQQQGVYGPP